MIPNAQVEFDKALRASLEKIVIASRSVFGDWQWRLATLPIKVVGLGILSARDIIHYAFLASRLQTSTLQAKIMSKALSVTPNASAPYMMKTMGKCYFGVIEKDLVPRYSLSPRQVVIPCI
ncbi:hypothetical protein Tco_0171389 [Tanacetum coccineum]